MIREWTGNVDSQQIIDFPVAPGIVRGTCRKRYEYQLSQRFLFLPVSSA